MTADHVQVRNLRTCHPTSRGTARAEDDVKFSLKPKGWFGLEG